MPANYTGDPAGEVDELPTISCPVGADPRNAASLNTPLQKIADVLAYLIDRTHPNVLAAGQTRVLISESDDNRGVAGTPKTRIYLNLDGEIEIARNCYWSALDAEWLADVWYPSRPNSCSLIILGIDGPQLRTFGSMVTDPTSTGWDDGDWTVQLAAQANGFMRFFDTIDPAATDAQANTLRAKNTPKAWGTILVSSGVASVEEGFNIAGASQSAGTLTVTFPTGAGMQNANYAAFATSMGALTAPAWGVLARRVGGLDLIQPGGDITTGTHRVSLLVFGRQDT